MTAIEIILIITGFAVLCISFFVSKRIEGEAYSGDGTVSETVWTEQEEKMIRDRIQEILKDYQMDIIDDTENQMNRLCNDKIMALDEFSQQILSKMESNHQEVVFMYNMLNEKEQEIAKIVSTSISSDLETDSQSQEFGEEIEFKEENNSGNRKSKRNSSPSVKRGKGKRQQENTKLSKEESEENKKTEEDFVSSGAYQENINLSKEMQEQIQKMYKEGKSVLEISRELKVGQGEVKLLIALYGGRRK